MKTLTELRASFWEQHPQFADLRHARKRQNAYPCDVRSAWCDFVDNCVRNKLISDRLAGRATL